MNEALFDWLSYSLVALVWFMAGYRIGRNHK